MNVDFELLVSVSRIAQQRDFALDDPNELERTRRLVSETETWLSQFKWVRRIISTQVGYVVPGVVGVLLMEIEAAPSIDRWLWVIYGDLPPAYISPEFASTPNEALHAYVAEMQAWVDAALAGEPVDELIPVDVPPTPASARALQQRLKFLRDDILPESGGG